LGHDFPNNFTVVPSTSLLTNVIAVGAAASQTMILIKNPNPNHRPVILDYSPGSPVTVYWAP
jgi:hypothetical protein